jgi:hypothetical protein
VIRVVSGKPHFRSGLGECGLLDLEDGDPKFVRRKTSIQRVASNASSFFKRSKFGPIKGELSDALYCKATPRQHLEFCTALLRGRGCFPTATADLAFDRPPPISVRRSLVYVLHLQFVPVQLAVPEKYCFALADGNACSLEGVVYVRTSTHAITEHGGRSQTQPGPIRRIHRRKCVLRRQRSTQAAFQTGRRLQTLAERPSDQD